MDLSESIGFRWRRRYNLPINDERALDVTEEDMLVDLVAHHLADEAEWRAKYPEVAEALDAMNDPAWRRDTMDGVRDWLADPAVQQALRRMQAEGG